MKKTSKRDRANYSFLPLLILDFPLKSYVTPFNFVPFGLAVQANKLQVLLAVPFGLLKSFPSAENGVLIENSFSPEGLSNASKHLERCKRPIVLWVSGSSRERLYSIMSYLNSSSPLGVLIIVEENSLYQYLLSVVSRDSFIELLCFSTGVQGDTSSLIWEKYLQLLGKLEKSLGENISFIVLPDRLIGKKISDILLTIQRTSNFDLLPDIETIPVYDDFIYYPNAIVLNHLRCKMPVWVNEKMRPEQNKMLFGYAREILERRNLNHFLDIVVAARMIKDAKMKLPEHITEQIDVFEKLLPYSFFQPLREIINGTKTIQEAEDIFKTVYCRYPTDVFYSCSTAEFILSCQSFPFSYQEVMRMAETRPDLELGYFTEADEDVHRRYFDQVLKGGRTIQFEVEPEDDRNMKAVKLIGELVSFENNYVSAMSVHYAMRRHCPVFKTERVGREIFSIFHQLDQLISKYNYQSIGTTLTNQRADVYEIELLMTSLSEELTRLISIDIIDQLFAGIADPRVLLISDIPLDFVRSHSDYLGYTTVLSRLPVTPGTLLLDYYNGSNFTTQLDNDVDQTIIVTSFTTGTVERRLLETAVEGFNYKSVSVVDIHSKFELINYVNNNDSIKCLIFFGHGGLDRRLNESWIELPNDNFFNTDIGKLRHVPKTIVLIGCNTSSGGNTICGMDIPFLNRGAQVIATTFPIPLLLGTLFVGMFLSNFLSAGVTTSSGARFYADLSDILTVVKRRLRVHSVLLNLNAQNKLKPNQDFEMLDIYLKNMEELEVMNQGNDANPFLAIKMTLLQEKFIDSMDSPLYSIEKIPYCLFFTCLGYTWDNQNKNFKK